MQTNKLGKTATKVFYTGNGLTVIRYHETGVVTFNDEKIVLNTGGYFTRTTKARMNQTSSQFNLGYRVYQEKGLWNVDYKGKNYLFIEDKIELNR